MKKLVLKAIRRYLRRHFPNEMDMIIKRADTILPELKAKAPDIGGKENSLSENLDMFLLFLSYYEASDHRMAGDAIDEIIDDLYRQFKWLNGIMNINRKACLSILRSYLYRSYTKYAERVRKKQSEGEWFDTWI